MSNDKSAFKFVNDEQRKQYIDQIIGFFHDERNEEIGLIAAEKMLDFFLASMGHEIYKKAIGDCRKLLTDRLEDLEYELDVLAPHE